MNAEFADSSQTPQKGKGVWHLRRASHSLGTMVPAAAIQDYGMQVEKLIMLNSAIPSEAFDPSLADPSPSNGLVHDEWIGYTNTCWASHWHEAWKRLDPNYGRIGEKSGHMFGLRMKAWFNTTDNDTNLEDSRLR